MFLLSTTGLQVPKKAFGMSSWKRNHPRKPCDFPGSFTKQHQAQTMSPSEVKLEISGHVFPTGDYKF